VDLNTSTAPDLLNQNFNSIAECLYSKKCYQLATRRRNSYSRASQSTCVCVITRRSPTERLGHTNGHVGMYIRDVTSKGDTSTGARRYEQPSYILPPRLPL
jgi:hypothetical protein